MFSRLLAKPEPYRPDLLPINKSCRGAITIVRAYAQAELYHDQPIGEPPFIEVPCEPSRKFFTGELMGYEHRTSWLVGFVSPTLEFLNQEDTLKLWNNLEPLLTWEAAETLGYSARYLEKLRQRGQGPKFWRVAENQEIYEVWYNRRDIEDFTEERKARPERRGGRRKRSG